MSAEPSHKASVRANPSTPPWLVRAIDTLDAIEDNGCVVTRFRLTATQADELERYTGQSNYLLGYPVAIVQRPRLRLA